MKSLAILAALAASSSMALAQSTPVVVNLSEWKISMPRDTVAAGAVTFRVNNNGSMAHALYVRGEGVDKGTREVASRQSATLSVTLKPGTYELFCPMSDESHKMAGMSRKIVVTPGADAKKP
jgi:plastocyanin